MTKILQRSFDYNKTINSYRNLIWFYDIWSQLTESKTLAKVLELADLKKHQ